MVEKMTFIKCGRFDDSCLRGVVKYTAGSLMDLEIVSCDVSDHGLSSLDQLQLVNLYLVLWCETFVIPFPFLCAETCHKFVNSLNALFSLMQ